MLLMLFTSVSVFSQDTEMDSLEQVYNSGQYEPLERSNILLELLRRNIDPKRNLYFSEELIQYAQEIDSSLLLYQGYLNKGNSLIQQGKNNEAMENYLRGAEIAGKEKVNFYSGEISVAIADLYSIMGNQNKANSFYKNAIAIFKDNDSVINLAHALNNFGDEYLNASKPDSAIQMFDEAVFIFEKYDLDEGVAMVLGKKAIAYSQKGQNEKSMEYLSLSMDLFAKMNKPIPLQIFLTNMLDLKNSKIELLKEQKDLLNDQKSGQWIMMFIIFLVLIYLLVLGLYKRKNYIEESERTNLIIENERNESDKLLKNILPSETAEELKENGKVDAEKFELVTVMFTDFKEFTKHSNLMAPAVVVKNVNYYFTEFDKIIEKHGLEKIKTIGDAYMCASGLHKTSNDNVESAVNAGLEILDFMKNPNKTKDPEIVNFEIRIGINTGPVVAGVVGIKKFAYDIWGDTVNIASRMESNSEPGRINISENTYELIKNLYNCEYRGETELKNRGLMKMYFLNDPKG
jgi:adenylate cyclase